MVLPTERQLFDLWERASAAPLSVRAGALLSLAQVVATRELVASMTLGERERALLELRRALLGSGMNALASCPGCGQRLDVEFDIDPVLAGLPLHIPETVTLDYDGLHITVRPLTVADFEAAASLRNAAAAAEALVACCVLEARRGDDVIEGRALSPGARAAIGAAIAEADPLCQLTAELECESCGNRWAAALDAAAYLWTELHMWAERVLQDVHALASAYGWSENDVLALTPWRRTAYAAMAGR